MDKKAFDESYSDLVKGQIASLHRELEEKDERLKEKDKEIDLLRERAGGVTTESVNFYKSRFTLQHTLFDVEQDLLSYPEQREALIGFVANAIAHMRVKNGAAVRDVEDVWLEVRVEMNKTYPKGSGDYYYRRAKVRVPREVYGEGAFNNAVTKEKGGDNE